MVAEEAVIWEVAPAGAPAANVTSTVEVTAVPFNVAETVVGPGTVDERSAV